MPITEEIFAELRLGAIICSVVPSHCHIYATHYLISSEVISIGRLHAGQSALNDVLVDCVNSTAIVSFIR